jgi:tetratricopeptide (TPR) repeat protein
MIVRNGGSGLARCLSSALPAIDGIVVGDTGSTDASREVAQRMGAQVLDVPWENDFAKARNAVLRMCRADWVLWLDADEMLDPEGAACIPALIAQDRIDAWEVWRWNYVRTLNSRSGELTAEPNPMRLNESRAYPAYTRYLNTLLFRRVPGLYFENRVHETVAKRVRALGLKAAEAPFVIHHFGFVEDAEQDRKDKCELYHQLGRQKVLENPKDDWAHYELGLSELEHRHDAAAALVCFQRVLELNPTRQGAWIYAGICLTRLGRLREAMDCLRHAEQMGVRSGLLQGALGDAYFHAGDLRQAAHCYRQTGEYGTVSALIECKLGVCQVQLGDIAAGLERIQTAIAREPETGELYEIWAAAAFSAGDINMAAQAATHRLSLGNPPAASFVIAAAFEARRGCWDMALSTLRDGLRRYPKDSVLEREIEVALQRIDATECIAATGDSTAKPAHYQHGPEPAGRQS